MRNKFKSGEENHKWKGGIHFCNQGYKYILKPEHPRAKVGNKRYVKESILVAEKALGKPIPLGCSVHHVDGDKMNNNNNNIVICQNDSYHRLLHYRTKALKECGDVHKKKCSFCNKWDNEENLFIPKRKGYYHRECRRKYLQEWRKRKLMETKP